MSCPLCNDPQKWEWLRLALDVELGGLPLNYCPVCSTPTAIRNFLTNTRPELLFSEDAMDEVILDENGRPMLQARTVHIDLREEVPVQNTEPESLAVNLDKINIDREMEFLFKDKRKD